MPSRIRNNMSKRNRSEVKTNARKKYKVAQTTLDPNTSGIYATCTRRHEKQAGNELMSLLEEKLEYYAQELKDINGAELDNPSENSKSEELSIEDQVKNELEELRNNATLVDRTKKKPILQQIPLESECMVFFKTRKPINPENFVLRIIQELASPTMNSKRTRYIQKLTPITSSCNASLEELTKLCQRVLPPHFHQEESTAYKFAIEVNKRNFNTLDKMDMINLIAREVGKGGQFRHTVDLKNYDKLVLVQCYKNNIGMSVVDNNYLTEYRKYNIQEIYEAKFSTKKVDSSPENKTE
ncbi:putative tRNA acetyltransferase Ecym_2582 [Eremothecium cymbalariae DBVPG|uniref:THUMP domain-containing protein n=1 Tax=Eremothecium cymbalariae (strain CBS 270.75 / DBVPG 7215 / KCTC 17166 / NRRL Y-17582) TaxID=931890 RepID=G8JQG5_ERECY|nr:Hypothetical protein Ecym_2582 [Eremothecium cymbalariae DBVPG\